MKCTQEDSTVFDNDTNSMINNPYLRLEKSLDL